MADLADVMDALQAIATEAAFPNGEGPGKTSVLGAGKRIAVGQGWPLAADIDAAMKSRTTLVSIYAVPSSSSDVPQPFINTEQALDSPNPGLSSTVEDATITLTGTAIAGEYITALVGGVPFGYDAQAGDSGQAVAAGLAQAMQTALPSTVAVGNTVQVATNQDILVRGGAPVTIVERIHRQRMQFRFCVWSPTPADRAAVGRAVDLAVKRNLVFDLADSSQALMTVQGANLDDKFENEGTYRRDLIVAVTFDTLDTHAAYPVTAVQFDFTPGAVP